VRRAGRFFDPQRNTTVAGTANRDREESLTKEHVEEQMFEGMATEICNRAWDDRQATKVSEAYADDDLRL
jgi:hypothetical protein